MIGTIQQHNVAGEDVFVGLAVRFLGQLVAHLLLRPPLGFPPAEEPEHGVGCDAFLPPPPH